MNKIIIKNNVLEEIDNEVFSIKNCEIIIKKSGEYVIEYQDCSLVNCFIKILKNKNQICYNKEDNNPCA